MPIRTVQEIRRDNLNYLIQTRFNGVANRLAVAAGLHQAQIARVFANGSSRRDVGKVLARKVERASGLDEGWLDQEHAASDEISVKLELLSIAQREAVENIIDQFISTKALKDKTEAFTEDD